MNEWILTFVIFSPVVGVVVLLLSNGSRPAQIRGTAFAFSLLTALLALVAAVMYYQSDGSASGGFALEQSVEWLPASLGGQRNIDVRYHVGVDGISLWLLLLTAFLGPLAIWASFTDIAERVKEYYALMLLLQAGMLGVFCAMDLLLFYVFFEFTLVPLYFLIGIWGGPEKRRAANKFFIYTLAGSVLTFAGVLFIAYFAYARSGTFTMDINTLTAMAHDSPVPRGVQWWLFLAFAAGFSIKVPLFPVHTWLPLAHTEAPTAGSVILAGILLKLGTYGFFRISLPMLPDGTIAFAPFMATLAVIGIIYGSLAAWVQRDIKKLVAYSSVAHLGFCMLGMFSLKMAGLSGSVMYMLNHGLSTGALFLVVGMVYERYHTRDIKAIGGLARPMPWLAFFLILFTLSSVGLPGLNGFVGEFMVLLGAATSQSTADGLPPGPLGYAYVIPAALGIILGAVYMFWMCQCVLFGPLKEPAHTPDMSRGLTRDLTLREIGILAPIAAACVIIGVWPKPVLKTLDSSIRANIAANYRDETVPDSGVETRWTEAVPESHRLDLFTDGSQADG
ncbi:MAG: NADH-quinone oxidoreductase subunit M [Phycisphaerales bacterium]|nr:MAG: NADH-quinone oxidoreductase subunit M [Phycisphaerales bacterium]